MKKAIRIAGIFLLSLLSCITGADEVALKNGNVMKGIVVESYKDRIVLRVARGEFTIQKKKILYINYSRPEQNYLKMGNDYADKADYEKALEYYNEALKAKPDFKDAIEAILRLKDAKEKHIVAKSALQVATNRSELKRSLGIVIEKEADNTKIVSVYPASPASNAGIKSGDIIIRVWDVSTKYESLDNIIELLLGDTGTSVRIIIGRKVNIVRRKIGRHQKAGIGISPDIKEEGLTITNIIKGAPAERAGLHIGDHIAAIDDESTRYLTLTESVRKMAGKEGTRLSLTIRRRLNLVRGKFEYKKPEPRGIGAKVSQVHNGIKIISPLPDSPAERAGLKKDDLLTRIEGRPLANMSFKKAVKLLRGAPGTDVSVTIERPVRLIRAKIPGYSFGGIGCSLERAKKGLVINKVSAGGPAEKAGIKAGDIIVGIENRRIPGGESLSESTRGIRGKAGKPLTLTISRAVTIRR